MPAKIQILIIDDHAIVREGLKFILHATSDLEVTAEASCVPEALELLKAQHFDVILLDLSLPGASGMDLLRTVKAKTPALPVLVVSAYAEDQYAVHVFKARAHDCINRESAPELLTSVVRRVACGRKYVSLEVAGKFASGLAGANKRPTRSYNISHIVPLPLSKHSSSKNLGA